jgi:hypothetical protein
MDPLLREGLADPIGNSTYLGDITARTNNEVIGDIRKSAQIEYQYIGSFFAVRCLGAELRCI